MIPVAELPQFEVAKGGSVSGKELLDPGQQRIALAAEHLDDIGAVSPHNVNLCTPSQPPSLLGLQGTLAHPPGRSIAVDPFTIVHGSWPLRPSGFSGGVRGTNVHVPERSRPLGAHEFDPLIESIDRDQEAVTLPKARSWAGSTQRPVGGTSGHSGASNVTSFVRYFSVPNSGPISMTKSDSADAVGRPSVASAPGSSFHATIVDRTA
jgi:hypothetical protein